MKEVIFSQGDFTLAKISGIGMNDTPWEGLEVFSTGKAEDFVIRIDLASNYAKFDGQPVHRKYYEVSVNHGMSSRHETLADTAEYIECLRNALEFARRVEKYIQENNEWSSNVF